MFPEIMIAYLFDIVSVLKTPTALVDCLFRECLFSFDREVIKTVSVDCKGHYELKGNQFLDDFIAMRYLKPKLLKPFNKPCKGF